MIEVQPFSYEPESCPKCGLHFKPERGLGLNPPLMFFCHHGSVFCRANTSASIECSQIDSEHLHVSCPRCGYEWLTETADAKKTEAA